MASGLSHAHTPASEQAPLSQDKPPVGPVRAVLIALPIALIWIYRAVVSPFLGPNCRYQPTCSAYAIDALRYHGVIHGSWLAVRRIARCHPWGGHGFDPIPHIADQLEQSSGCCSSPSSPQARD